jgi:hypothetical protein
MKQTKHYKFDNNQVSRERQGNATAACISPFDPSNPVQILLTSYSKKETTDWQSNEHNEKVNGRDRKDKAKAMLLLRASLPWTRHREIALAIPMLFNVEVPPSRKASTSMRRFIVLELIHRLVVTQGFRVPFQSGVQFPDYTANNGAGNIPIRFASLINDKITTRCTLIAFWNCFNLRLERTLGLSTCQNHTIMF